MKSTHRYKFVDAKISNFIHRKTATIGQRFSTTHARPSAGMDYELTGVSTSKADA